MMMNIKRTCEPITISFSSNLRAILMPPIFLNWILTCSQFSEFGILPLQPFHCVSSSPLQSFRSFINITQPTVFLAKLRVSNISVQSIVIFLLLKPCLIILQSLRISNDRFTAVITIPGTAEWQANSQIHLTITTKATFKIRASKTHDTWLQNSTYGNRNQSSMVPTSMIGIQMMGQNPLNWFQREWHDH